MAVASLPREPAPEYPAIKPGMMGMYIFLASEVMFFGSMFAMYFYLVGSHNTWPPPAPSSNPEYYVSWWPISFVNTIVLGLGFEFGQLYEFINAFGRGLNLTANTFASAFFTMTGFHGAHVLGGLILLTLILYRAARGQFSSRNHVGPAAVTLYWHFVDVVWIFLFGILYLGVTAFK